MSSLWLDNELQDFEIEHIASALRTAGLTEAEADQVFALELAPVLGWNHGSAAGVWEGFDADWVCREAQLRLTGPRLGARLAARLGLSTYGARSDWARVKRAVYG